MHMSFADLPWILLLVSACAHGLVILRLAAYRRDRRAAGIPYFFIWQTWDIRNYTDEGKHLFKWLPITAIAFITSGVLFIVL